MEQQELWQSAHAEPLCIQGRSPMTLLAVNDTLAEMARLWPLRLIRTGQEQAFKPALPRWLVKPSHRALTVLTGFVVRRMFVPVQNVADSVPALVPSMPAHPELAGPGT